MTRLTLLPAVDIAGGRAAQVVTGTPGAGVTGTTGAAPADDPVEVVQRWVDAGATWIHLVDLDRAFGRGHNRALLEDLVHRIPVPVQLSGGIADEATLSWALGTGAARAVLASSVLAEPDLVSRAVAEHGERVVVAVDVRAGRVVSRGTDLDLGPVDAVLGDHPVRAARQVLVADASRDGTRAGSDLRLFADVAELVTGDVVASGGVASLDDLRALAGLHPRVRSAVLGAALYHGAFTLQEALEVCR